jgi:hypothetical protein
MELGERKRDTEKDLRANLKRKIGAEAHMQISVIRPMPVIVIRI